MKIAVEPPDVNESEWSFTVDEESIRFGLGAVKGVGSSAVEAILEARRRIGRFRSLAGFACEVDLKAVNHKVFECLIKAGSLDGIGAHRAALMGSLDRILDYAQSCHRDQEEGQDSLFAADAIAEPEVDDSVPRWPDRERLRYEKEVLGLYLTGNPLSEYRERLRELTTHTSAELDGRTDGPVTVGGLVTRVRSNKIRSGPNAGRLMGRFVLEDLEGRLPVALFADQYDRFGKLLQEESVVVVRGAARDRGSGPELTVEEMAVLDLGAEPPVHALDLELSASLSTSEMLELRDFLVEHRGEVPVHFEMALGGRKVRIVPEERFRVEVAPELLASLQSLVGPGKIRRRYGDGSSSRS